MNSTALRGVATGGWVACAADARARGRSALEARARRHDAEHRHTEQDDSRGQAEVAHHVDGAEAPARDLVVDEDADEQQRHREEAGDGVAHDERGGRRAAAALRIGGKFGELGLLRGRDDRLVVLLEERRGGGARGATPAFRAHAAWAVGRRAVLGLALRT